MEALMTLDCSDYSESIADVLKIFQQIGWYIYNPVFLAARFNGVMTMSTIGNVTRYLKVSYMILFLKKLLAKNR